MFERQSSKCGHTDRMSKHRLSASGLNSVQSSLNTNYKTNILLPKYQAIMPATISPPLTSATELFATMRESGVVVVSADDVQQMFGLNDAALNLKALNESWDDLARDQYLKDGGRYRLRRHACYIVNEHGLNPVGHRAHFQPIEYNALHGGMYRRFEPVRAKVSTHEAWQQLLLGAAKMCTTVKPDESNTWYIEAHQFRIDTTDGIGRPTPEGAHRDGVDFVMVFLLNRVDIKGGETRVFDAQGTSGQRFTLSEPWSLLWMDDQRVIHESTPIQPEGEYGYRDTLVLTFRRGGFLGEYNV